MSALTEIQPYVEAFKARPEDSLIEQRRKAIKKFAELGFPTRKQEAWRFTDLRPLQRAALPPATAPGKASEQDIAPWLFAGNTHRLVLVDGQFAPGLSRIGKLPTGARLVSTAAALKEDPKLLEAALRETDTLGNQPFISLNAALFSDGFVLTLDENVRLDRPVEIVHWATGGAHSFHTRNIMRLGKNSHAMVIETYAGMSDYWTNVAGLIGVGDHADLTHVKLQDESTTAIHLGHDRVELDRAAHYESFVLALGGRLARHDIQARLNGEGARCHLNGAYLLRGEQEGTIATLADHAAPGGTTREVFKGMATDRAHGVFLGAIEVRPDAQKTDAAMLNKNLLLSPRAAIDTKPELDILADDVKCSHGATVGDLDEAALFYLESRGIPADEARRMLVEAFVTDAIEQVRDTGLRAHLGRHVARWLAGGTA